MTWGLPEGGRKVGASLYFDGNFNDKLFIPIAFDMMSELFGNNAAGYVKISDNFLPLGLDGENGLVTIGGLGNFVMFMLNATSDILKDFASDITESSVLQTVVQSNGSVVAINSSLYEDVTIGQSPFTYALLEAMYITGQGAKFAEATIPVIFHVYEPNDIFPEKGTYMFGVLVNLTGQLSVNIFKTLPHVFINDYFAPSLNLSRQVEWSTLNFNNNHEVVYAKDNALIQTGEVPNFSFTHNNYDYYLMTTKTNEWMQLISTSTISCDSSLGYAYDLPYTISVLNGIGYCAAENGMPLLILIPIDCYDTEHGKWIPRGVYLIGDAVGDTEGKVIFNQLQDIENIYYHKLPHYLYDCPAYEERKYTSSVITWDGVNKDEAGDIDMMYTKIADENALTEQDIIEDIVFQLNDGTILHKQDIIDQVPDGQFMYIPFNDAMSYYVYKTDTNTFFIFAIVKQTCEPLGESSYGILTPGVYGLASIFVLPPKEIHFKGNKKIVHRLDEKFLPEGMMLVPIPSAEQEGNILQVVNGQPTWVSIPSAESSTF